MPCTGRAAAPGPNRLRGLRNPAAQEKVAHLRALHNRGGATTLTGGWTEVEARPPAPRSQSRVAMSIATARFAASDTATVPSGLTVTVVPAQAPPTLPPVIRSQ